MRQSPRSIAALFVVLLLILPSAAPADELEMINRPVNSQGLTGLLFTTAPYTLPHRTFEIGASTLSERSFSPDYTVSSYALTITYGLTGRSEIALKSAYWYEEDAAKERTRGMGDSEIAYKWSFLGPREDSARPALSIISKVILPTGDRSSGMNSVENWGAGIGLAAGGEVFLEDYVMGYYADGMVLGQDLQKEKKHDKYLTANAGVLLPISKHRNLQMFLEYNLMRSKDAIFLNEVDFTAVTYGLRLVNSRYNLTFGSQFKHRNAPGYDNASRIIGMASIKL